MKKTIENVVILGGGTAGWMTAAYLAKATQRNVNITVLEAPAVPRIGVGEATLPSLQRAFFDFLELPEEAWMPQCNASIKAAVKFVNWQSPAVAGKHNHFYHPFGVVPMCDGIPLSQFWAMKRIAGEAGPYDYACLAESPLLDAKLSPRHLDGTRVTNYAWHFNAQQVADFLRDFSIATLGVHHVMGEMDSVAFDDRGFITALKTKEGLTIPGDFFVDCSGFRGLLINKAMKEPFVDMNDHLLCDSAVAAQVPHDDERYGIEPFTSAIAMRSGWTWKIPLRSRFGSGYVFSSRFCDYDEAARDFCQLWNLNESKTELNKIRFRVGRNRRAWVKNCVSIGLASCFLEPLESTGIYFIYAAVYQLARHFPDKEFNPKLIENFNREIEFMFDDCRDFIQAHYVISPREDTPFWRTNKYDLVISDNLKDKMDLYQSGYPLNAHTTNDEHYYGNFDFEFRNFWTNHNYYCIFSGLGFLPKAPLPILKYRPESCRKAALMCEQIRLRQAELVAALPTMYRFLEHLHSRERHPVWSSEEKSSNLVVATSGITN